MMEKLPEDARKNTLMRFIVLIIVVSGGCLGLYSIYMVTMHINDLNWLVLDMIMLGFGFAAIWFGLAHFDIQKSENKLQKINEQADRIKDILERK
jgi:arginine exporter protein ArgO